MRPDPPRGTARPRAVATLAVALVIATGAGLAQESEDPIGEQIRQSQDRLQQIRSERERLRTQLANLESRVHNVSEEIRNLEGQIGTSSSAIAELKAQLNALLEQVTITTRDVLLTHDRLTARKVVLRRRLREIYKRGPLAPVQVLLTASSFADLLNRYKYLHQVALFDRLLVEEVGRLEDELEDQRLRLESELDLIQSLRSEKGRELTDLRQLERQRQRRLTNYTNQESQTRTRLSRLAEQEQRLRDQLADLERQRLERERRSGVATVSTLRTSDLGQLNWPVEGAIVYNFGPERRENTTIFREGIGIAAAAGTPVRAVETGTVAYASSRGLYGLSVILDHGGGYYSVYLYMQSLSVVEGQPVESGEVIGRVGGAASPEGPHVEFQIHEPSGGGMPRAVDPVRWLRGRR